VTRDIFVGWLDVMVTKGERGVIALWGELRRATVKNFYRCRVRKFERMAGTLAET
jgi:predicted translin family RNA/ssDNA-binding protein